jgi:hypothetical protein
MQLQFPYAAEVSIVAVQFIDCRPAFSLSSMSLPLSAISDIVTDDNAISVSVY